MRKQLKGIIGLGAVLVVLGGGFAALKLTEPKDEPSEPSIVEPNEPDEGAGIILVSGNETDEIVDKPVKSVLVVNSTDELHVIKKTNDEGNVVYTLEGYDDLNVNNSVVGTLANNGNGLASQALIEENCENPGKFGLDDPITVELTYESGKMVRFFIGNNAPSGSVTYVMTDDGSNTVYTVSSSTVANYSKTTKEFIRNTVLEKPDDEDYPRIDSLTIERDDLDYNIVIEYDASSEDSYSGGTSSTHIMLEPTRAYLSADRSSDIVNGMFGLTGRDIYALHCKESDIAGAGLNDPFCRVTMSCDDGKDYVLLLSEIFADENGNSCCYGMLEGGNVIYILSADTAKWVKVMPIDIASTIMIGNYVWNITELSIKYGDQKAEFKIAPKDDSVEVQGASASDFNVTMNGKAFDSERYRQFYAFLVTANAEEFALDKEIPSGEPLAEIVYKDSYTNETTTIQFYDESVMKSLIVINGESKFYCTKAFVQTMIGNAERIDTDEAYVLNW